jgi:nicotinamide phosphoribosyltransferase
MINKFNPMLMTDFYKIGHPFQYPKGTTMVYSNLTPRKSRLPGIDKMVFFGLQYFIKEYLITQFNENFFKRPFDEVIPEYKRVIKNTIGDLPSYTHIENLHKLGYLPIHIKALPEGTSINMRVPVLTIVNTLPEFYWVTNFVESLLTATTWQSSTSATISKTFFEVISEYGERTGIDKSFIQWQGHDFSFRGMSSFESALLSSMGHLAGGFTGTDSIVAIYGVERYYGGDVEKQLIGGSCPATEHATMCAGIITLEEELKNGHHPDIIEDFLTSSI